MNRKPNVLLINWNSITRAAALLWTIVLFGCGPRFIGPEPLVDERIQEAKKLFQDEKYFDAKEKFETIRFEHPGHVHVGEVQFYIGLCNFHLHDYIVAEQEFRILLREFPATHAYADDASYYICKSLYEQSLPPRLDQSLTRQTLEEIEAFIDTYPESEFTGKVVTLRRKCLDKLAEKDFLAGRLYRRMGHPPAAIHYFKLVEDQYPASKWSIAARLGWARAEYDREHDETALAHADTALAGLQRFEKTHAALIDTPRKLSFFYKLTHCFGLIQYDTRNDLRRFLDEMREGLDTIVRKASHRKSQVRRKSKGE